MSILLATLHCASGRTIQALTGNNVTELSANTYAGTFDGSDLTEDSAMDAMPAALDYIVTYLLETSAVIGTIDFVRWRARARRSPAGATATIQPVLNRIQRGAQQILGDAFAWFQADFVVDPATGFGWTNALVNGQSWGFDAGSGDPGASSTVEISELLVELWGSTAPPPNRVLVGDVAVGLAGEGLTLGLTGDAQAGPFSAGLGLGLAGSVTEGSG